jgi:hypothetical protein
MIDMPMEWGLGNVLAISDRNSLTKTQMSIWFVLSIKENDEKQLAGSQHNGMCEF